MLEFLLGSIIGIIFFVLAKTQYEKWICNQVSEADKQRMKKEINSVAEKVKSMDAEARKAAESLRIAADYLDEVGKNCKTASAMGITSSIVGGLLTIAGVIFTPITAAVVSPLLTVGQALGFAGALVNLGARGIEIEANSSQFQAADAAVKNVSQHVDEVRRQILMLKHGKDQAQLLLIATLAGEMYGVNHLAVALIKSGQRPDQLLKGMHDFAKNVVRELAMKFGLTKTPTATTKEIVESGSKSGAVKAVEAVAKRARMILGVSVAFLVFDTIDLHFTVRDIIKNKGSYASRLLRGKADELEALVRV